LADAAQQDAVTTKLQEVVNGNFVLAEKTVENIKLWELVLGGKAQTAREREREREREKLRATSIASLVMFGEL
jgi:hypothetical protein